MKLQRLLGALAAGLMIYSLPAAATEQSTTVMPIVGPMSMAVFAGKVNDSHRAMMSCSWGPSAPANGPSGAPIAYQCWADTTTNPVVFKYYDGASWATYGKLNTSTHVWTPSYQGTDLGTASTATTGTSGHTLGFLDGANTWSAVQSFNSSMFSLKGSSSGAGTLNAPAAASTYVWTMPAATGTIMDTAFAQTVTNKTINCANNTCTVRLASDVTGALPLANIATGTQDTALGYWGSTTASAIAIGNCANALTYSTATHTFGCNSIAGTGTVTSSGTPTNHQTAVWTSATDAKGIGPGTTGQQLISNGASADPSYTSGGWVLLNTLTASASSTLSDTTNFTATYNDYELVFTNILPSTTAQCQLQVHSGGSFQTTSYSSPGIVFSGSASSVATSTTFVGCSNVGSADVTTAGGVSGSIRVSVPNNTTANKQWNGNFTYFAGGSGLSVNDSGGWLGGTGALTGFQVKFSTGNITSGTIKVYGRL